MISAELTIIPIGTGKTSISKYIAAAVQALDEMGLKYEISGMGTSIETDNPEKLFNAVQAAHEAVFREGARRVATSIKIDDRRDIERTMANKVSSVKEKL
ncbi:MAG: MTH1187 family thiamine-binding protein [Euryarchaeota archaeon]|nr:MTH1187 family thiamine-binding protein [Euryarchaeota archaeon]